MSESAAVAHESHSHDHQASSLQHHFATYEQQMDASKIGMWLFLATEILLFGGLFVGFGLMQAKYPDAFVQAHHHLDKNLGFLNTVVLLLSSFTMVMAVHCAKTEQRAKTLRYLLVTLL